MSALGMPSAFIHREAQFPNLCYWGNSEDNVKEDIYIDRMKLVAKIKVNEEGSEAAAVTVIGITENAAAGYAEFIADRPFLYVISECSTGAIFFIGQYMGDGTTGVGDAVHRNDREQKLKSKYYNLNGQQLQAPPAKGLYISNGRKVLR